MRIGFDAKWFFSGNKSGRVVVRNSLEQLIVRNPEHEFFIFLKKKEKTKDFPFKNSNVHLIYVWGGNNLISNLFVVPLRARSLKLDVMIFQYFAPFISNFWRVVLINDIIFKSHPEYFTLLERIYFFPMKFLAKKSHHVCTISHSEKTRMRMYGFAPENKIAVIYLGIDKRFKPKKYHKQEDLREVISRYNLPEKFILYVGRLNVRKNITSLLKSISILGDKKIKLVLAGEYNWKMFNLPNKIKELGVSDRIILTGFVQDEHLPILYSLASIFCYIPFDEGFGIPPLEAMASGIPVVVGRTGSLPEICGSAGNYVDPSSPEEIAAMMETLLDNPKLYEEKARAGIHRAKQFTWENSAEALMRVFHKFEIKKSLH